MIFTARTAGKRPPTTPIITASPIPWSSTLGPNLKEKVISLKVAKLVVPVERPLIGQVSRQPIRPPMEQMKIDSRRKAERMVIRGNPSARSVPISRDRDEIAANMVLAAANMAPTVKKLAITYPTKRSTLAASIWSSK